MLGQEEDNMTAIMNINPELEGQKVKIGQI